MNIYRTRYVQSPKLRYYVPSELLQAAIDLYNQKPEHPALTLAVALVRTGKLPTQQER